jgi:hypothetical protein
VLHVGVGAWKYLRDVTVFPTHHVRRCPVVPEHLEDLPVTLRLAKVMAFDDETITRTGSQDGFAR